MDIFREIGFKPKSLGIALDPAHGLDTEGKRSPDGKHIEAVWSRERINEIIDLATSLKSKEWDLLCPFISNRNEPGLIRRVDTYNDIANDYDLLIVLSLHNDALKNPPAWWSGKGGFTLFTSRGETVADPLCTLIGESLAEGLENEHFRFDFGLSRNETEVDLDREANFTVITGYGKGDKRVSAKYAGILIENLFMDIKSNYEKLTSPEWNKNLVEVYVGTLLTVATKLGFDNYIGEIKVSS